MTTNTVAQLVEMSFSLRGGTLFVHWLFIGLVLLGVASIFFLRKRRKKAKYKQGKITLKFGNMTQEIYPSHEAVNIAYKAWIEIATRKVGIAFDDNHDVISEVYDSWHSLFDIIRELTKSIPAENLATCENTRKLVQILTAVLNAGLRPHLTQWQAKFRRWYQHELDDEGNKNLTPQEIQKRYKDYQQLVEDLKDVNKKFVTFANDLRSLAGAQETPATKEQ